MLLAYNDLTYCTLFRKSQDRDQYIYMFCTVQNIRYTVGPEHVQQ